MKKAGGGSSNLPGAIFFKMSEKRITIMVVVIFLVIISTFYFFVFKETSEQDPNNYIYNDFRVIKSQNPNIVGYAIIGYLEDQPYQFNLRNDPIHTENITVQENAREILLTKPKVYLTMAPNLTSKSVIAALEVANTISRKLGIYNIETIGALTRPAPNNPTEVITCDNITQKQNVILFKLGDETKVFLEGECIIIQGTNEWEIIRAADRLVYDVLEVI